MPRLTFSTHPAVVRANLEQIAALYAPNFTGSRVEWLSLENTLTSVSHRGHYGSLHCITARNGARRTFDAAYRTSHGCGRLYGGANIFAELKFSRVKTDNIPQWHQRLTRRHHIHCLARKTLTRGRHT